MTVEYEPACVYRGVPIQNFQTRDRIERRVKPEIDRVMGMTAIDQLLPCCADVSRPPEARLLAGAMLEMIFAQAATDRRVRPDIDLEKVRACTAGLEEGSAWRSPMSYGCIADDRNLPGLPHPELRPVPLTDEQLGRNSRPGTSP